MNGCTRLEAIIHHCPRNDSVRWSPEFPFPGQHSFSTHEALGRRMLFGLTKKGARELTMADRRPIVAKYLATNRKPKSVANLLPIFYSQAFVFVRLW
jgi:hypothetical protein